MKRIATAVTVAGLTLVPAASAWAHAETSHLTPQPGSTVDISTKKVSLRFSERVLGGSIKVKDARGRTVSSGSKLVRAKTALRARMSLHKGRFTVKAKWLADDGDRQTKTWHFSAR